MSGFQITEIPIEAHAGSFRITCSWQQATPLQISITGAAGHGLPGRIGLGSKMGQSPLTVDVQVEPEQVARGPIYVELSPAPFQRRNADVVRGMLIVTTSGNAPEGTDEGDERGLVALQEGRLFSESEVTAAESRLKLDPQDWPVRLALLGYYYSSADLRMSKAQIVVARRRHILWTIENRAADPDIFEIPDLQISNTGPLADPLGAKQGVQAWQHQLDQNKQNGQVLLNAAMFSAAVDPTFCEKVLEQESIRSGDLKARSMLGMMYATAMISLADDSFAVHARNVLASSDDPFLIAAAAAVLSRPTVEQSGQPPEIRFARPKYMGLAEELSARAISLDPYNPVLLWSLLQVLSEEVDTAETNDQRTDAEQKMYGLVRHLNEVASDPMRQIVLLPILANLAFDLNDDQAAKTYATEALNLVSGQKERISESSPEAIHDANDVLGRIALRSGDLEGARDYLLRAATILQEHAWRSRAPRMALAQSLLDRGERDVVLKYLEEMKTSWSNGLFLLQRWIETIRQNKTRGVKLLNTRFLSPLR
jgi:hypothetical protein